MHPDVAYAARKLRPAGDERMTVEDAAVAHLEVLRRAPDAPDRGGRDGGPPESVSKNRRRLHPFFTRIKPVLKHTCEIRRLCGIGIIHRRRRFVKPVFASFHQKTFFGPVDKTKKRTKVWRKQQHVQAVTFFGLHPGGRTGGGLPPDGDGMRKPVKTERLYAELKAEITGRRLRPGSMLPRTSSTNSW